MTGKQWVKRWKHWVLPTKLPGVWQMKEGGHLVRVRIVDPTTGHMKEIKRVMPEADAESAFRWLTDEKDRIRSGNESVERPQTRFSDFAVSLCEKKVLLKEIRSARGREKWKHTLEHLIAGTRDVAGFGEMFMDKITSRHIEAWRLGIARLIAAKEYAPTTANGWLGILKVITKAAKRELGLASDPAEEVAFFRTDEHVVYSDEEPNALTPEEAKRFLACMREEFPQHFAMTYLGLATGLRPSSMRPLRRKGLTPDVRWDEGVILVRRSHTLGEEVMESTKTGLRQRITVPSELLDVLRWHVDTQLLTPEQKASDLLFPREDGGIRSESALKKAFDVVGRLIGLPKKFTPRGLRRTFNDVARAAKVESLVTRSISGHLTERMKDHYSTVQPVEQRESIGRVLRLVRTAGTKSENTTRGGAPGGAPRVRSGAPRKEAIA